MKHLIQPFAKKISFLVISLFLLGAILPSAGYSQIFIKNKSGQNGVLSVTNLSSIDIKVPGGGTLVGFPVTKYHVPGHSVTFEGTYKGIFLSVSFFIDGIVAGRVEYPDGSIVYFYNMDW